MINTIKFTDSEIDNLQDRKFEIEQTANMMCRGVKCDCDCGICPLEQIRKILQQCDFYLHELINNNENERT